MISRYTLARNRLGEADYVPQLPIAIVLGTTIARVSALLDTGSSVNVLPYQIGHELGATWDEQGQSIPLGGTMSQTETRPLELVGLVGDFAPVRLLFIWVRTDNVPALLGQTNFFMEFDVCFYRSRLMFEVHPK